MTEVNPLVISGEYTRVFASELQPGEVTVFGEVISSVVILSGERVGISYTDGSIARYSNPTATVLIRTDSLQD